nr:retrovirus-related Pol polyprotein from transposon TNT 1-94 [Tanacetum cinerariifolium]
YDNGSRSGGRGISGNIGIGGGSNVSGFRNQDAYYNNGSRSRGRGRGKSGNIGGRGSSTSRCGNPDADYNNCSISRGRGRSGNIGGRGSSSISGCGNPVADFETNDNETETSQRNLTLPAILLVFSKLCLMVLGRHGERLTKKAETTRLRNFRILKQINNQELKITITGKTIVKVEANQYGRTQNLLKNITQVFATLLDAGYMSDPHIGRPKTGYVSTSFDVAISWRSVKLTMSATLSNLVKILAIHEASRECVWLRSVIQHIRELCRISSGQEATIVLHKDNATCIAQLKDGYIKGDRFNHILAKFFFTHELHKSGDIIVQKVRSSDNLADLITKALPSVTFKKLVHGTEMRRLNELK